MSSCEVLGGLFALSMGLMRNVYMVALRHLHLEKRSPKPSKGVSGLHRMYLFTTLRKAGSTISFISRLIDSATPQRSVDIFIPLLSNG